MFASKSQMRRTSVVLMILELCLLLFIFSPFSSLEAFAKRASKIFLKMGKVERELLRRLAVEVDDLDDIVSISQFLFGSALLCSLAQTQWRRGLACVLALPVSFHPSLFPSSASSSSPSLLLGLLRCRRCCRRALPLHALQRGGCTALSTSDIMAALPIEALSAEHETCPHFPPTHHSVS